MFHTARPWRRPRRLHGQPGCSHSQSLCSCGFQGPPASATPLSGTQPQVHPSLPLPSPAAHGATPTHRSPSASPATGEEWARLWALAFAEQEPGGSWVSPASTLFPLPQVLLGKFLECSIASQHLPLGSPRPTQGHSAVHLSPEEPTRKTHSFYGGPEVDQRGQRSH